MQREPRKTKVTVREDYPTSVSSSIYGANLDVVAFNMQYVNECDPKLGVEVMELYKKANKLRRRNG